MRSHEEPSRVSQVVLDRAAPPSPDCAPVPPQNLQHVHDAIAGRDGLTKIQRDRHQSNVRRIARLVCGHAETSLADVCADPDRLEESFARALATCDPQDRKKVGNLVSHGRLALRAGGVPIRDGHGRKPLSTAWTDSTRKLKLQEWERTALANFAAWCTGQSIEPREVEQSTFDRYETVHGQTHGRARDSKSGRQQFRALVRVWNEHVHAKRLGGVEHINCEDRTDWYRFPQGEWPEVFRAEVEDWARYAQHCNPKDPTAPKPVGAVTAANEARLIFAMASAYCRQTGLSPASISSISDFVNAEGAGKIFDFMYRRADRVAGAQSDRTEGLYQVARLLAKLGKYWLKLPPLLLVLLLKYRHGLGPSVHQADNRIPLSEGRRRIIAAFSDERLAEKLRDLPTAIYEDFPFDRMLTDSEVVKYTTAFALSFIWVTRAAPKLLVSVKLEDLLYDLEDGAPVVFMRYDRWDATSLRFVGERARLFRLYLKYVRPLQPGRSTPYLFPGMSGPCNANWFSKKIAALTHEHLGVRVTASQVIAAITMAAALKSSPEMAVGLARWSLKQKRVRPYDAELLEIKRHLAARHVDRLLDAAQGSK